MLKVLIVDDDEAYVDELKAEALSAEALPRCETRLAVNGQEAREAILRFRPDLVLVDMIFPPGPDAYPCIDAGVRVIDFLQQEHPSATVVVLSIRDREFAVKLLTSRRIADFLFKDLTWSEIAARLARHLDTAAARKRQSLLEEEATRLRRGREFLTADPGTLEVLGRVEQVATTDTTVLILGESGTGKEILAHRIHQQSTRAASAFIAVNCGALDENLVGSELFGHVKGAFTGAVTDRPGKFELAHGGTLFLDEVGELSPTNQVRLLRVLEERTFERVGGSDVIESDVRLIAATNRDIEAMVGRGDFREDLFFRLNVFSLTIPPLRERPRDIVLLAEQFARSYSEARGRRFDGFSQDALSRLTSYHWPGNVRQLSNVVEQAVILDHTPRISAEMLPLMSSHETEANRRELFRPGIPFRSALDALERQYLEEVLRYYAGDTKRAAANLDIPLRTLQSRLRRLGVRARTFKAPS